MFVYPGLYLYSGECIAYASVGLAFILMPVRSTSGREDQD